MKADKEMDWIDLLKGIQKPGRYTGHEWNSVRKNPSTVKVRIALVFPDLYEIGMSYLGQKILYADINAHKDYAAERVFAPWPDFEKRLRERNVPLFSLENRTPLQEFDLLGFSLLYELNYSNVLTILDLGGIPLKSGDRSDSHPLVIAGGPAAFNPEPIADIFDAFLIGDGEQAVFEILALFADHHKALSGESRAQQLQRLSGISGIYVPSLYAWETSNDQSLVVAAPVGEAPPAIEKRVVSSFKRRSFPEDIIVPNIKTVFDRVSVEAARGCPERCRFCQASVLYFPPRAKDPDQLVKTVRNSVHSTGYDEASLTALSIGDYPYIHQVLDSLMNGFEEERISLSLSSLRPKSLTKEIAENIVRVRKTGFTLVPEAGTERLRCVINKSLTDEEIRQAVENAFSEGWRLIKLYFMVGLPTETEADLEGIVETVQTIIQIGSEVLKKAPQINLSVSSFIPKPHTPFQWEGMDPPDILSEKHRFIRSRLKKYRSVKFNRINPQASLLEAVFSRGDRRLNDVLLEAWSRGARFDSWDELFYFQAWEEAFRKKGLDFALYLKSRQPDVPLPWDHISTGIPKSTLLEERRKAYSAVRTSSCLKLKCAECRSCSLWTGYEKRFPQRDIEAAIPPESFGIRKERSLRYRVTYAKMGLARFLGHNDMNNIIQRSLRRAGIPVLFSRGFHPKMLLIHLPALPLGMEGEEELFEFLSPHDMDEGALIERLKRSAPEGIEFLKAIKVPKDADSLHNSVECFVYSVDLRDKDIYEVSATENPLGGERWGEWISEKIEAYLKGADHPPPGLEGINFSPEDCRLEIVIKSGVGKTVRPQDVVQALFDVPYPTYAISRKRVVIKHQ
jgi:radical SAM family uncharacterized protein/radical SAM-linked protein